MNLHLSANLSRLANNTSGAGSRGRGRLEGRQEGDWGANKKVFRLVGKGFCEVIDLQDWGEGVDFFQFLLLLSSGLCIFLN